MPQAPLTFRQHLLPPRVSMYLQHLTNCQGAKLKVNLTITQNYSPLSTDQSTSCNIGHFCIGSSASRSRRHFSKSKGSCRCINSAKEIFSSATTGRCNFWADATSQAATARNAGREKHNQRDCWVAYYDQFFLILPWRSKQSFSSAIA